MKKNLYYRTLFRRTNRIKEVILTVFLAIASWPRLILEVFLRKNFGERYFSFATVVILAIALTIIPFAAFGTRMLFSKYGDTGSNWLAFIWAYMTWYGFVAAFVYFGLKRRREVMRNPSVFDLKRFSLYSGDIRPSFYNIRLFGKTPNPRTVEILYEPAVCFLAGLPLILFGQMIGLVIIGCSIVYCLSYAGAYYQGDHFVMDKIDEMICNEEMFNSFVEDKDSSETRGVRFYGRKPVSDEVRRKVVESFTEDAKEEVFEAM